jgi:hypothetical protein
MTTIPNLNTAQYHKDDTGKIIYCHLNCETTKSYDFYIVIRKPSGIIVEVVGTPILVDGIPYLKYVVGAGVLSEVGCYKAQSKVIAGRSINFGQMTSIKVQRNL